MAEPRSRFDKAAFFHDLGYAPHPGQVEIHLDEHPRRIVACGVRWGKTLCAAMEGLVAAMAPRERSIGWVVAPTYDLATKVHREIVLHAHKHLKHRIVQYRESSGELVLRNLSGGLSEIRTRSADNPVSLLGEGLDWLIVDEASRLKPDIWQSHLSQRLIDRKGWALLISTPKGKGYFHELYRLGQGHDPAYRSWNNPSWTNPHLDAALIEEQRRQVPERVFNQEYGAQFIEGSGAVFRYVREAATGHWKEPMRPACYYAGLDLAKTEDYTVLVILDGTGQVVAMDRFNRLDWSIQVQRIKSVTDRYNQAEMHIDSTGAGEPIYETLKKEGCRARAYPFTQKSKSALIDNLAIKLEKRELMLPRPQLCSAGLNVRERDIWKFEQNYRNTKQIAQLALAIAKSPHYRGIADLIEPNSPTADGPPPALVGFMTEARELQFVAARAQKLAETGTVAVLFRDRELEQVLPRLVSVTPTRLHRDLNIWPRGPGLFYGTYHAAKGLEFDSVLVPFASSERLPHPPDVTDFGVDDAAVRNTKLLYVAVTRAKSNLVITHSGAPTALLPIAAGLLQRSQR